MKKRTLKKLIFAFFILIFLFVLSLVLFYEVNFFDEKTYELISKLINDNNTLFFKFFTFMGSTLAIVSLCIISLIFFKKYGFYVCLNSILAVTGSQILKFLVKRTRPIDINLIEETGFGFPSGHSMVSAAFYGLIIYFVYKSNSKKSTKIVAITVLTTIIFLVGISRIYLGVHYATDVIGGFSLATIHLFLFVELIYKNKLNFTFLKKLK